MSSKIKTKRERVKFASDNVAGACPEVLDAIIKANEGDSTPYGNDEWSTNLQNKFDAIKDIPTSINMDEYFNKSKEELQTEYDKVKVAIGAN